MKAQEEWQTANKLNSDAATKILSIRNDENDIWRLDLHGLHAAEAIQALQEHLHRIESQGFSKSSAPTNGVKENGHAHLTPGSINLMDRENLDKPAPIRLRSLTLHVITGMFVSFRSCITCKLYVYTYIANYVSGEWLFDCICMDLIM